MEITNFSFYSFSKSQELRVHGTRPLQIEYDQPDQVTLISSFPGGWSSCKVIRVDTRTTSYK